MELTDSTQGNSEPTVSILGIDLNEVPSSSSFESLSRDAISVVRTFHGELTPPAGVAAELPDISFSTSCSSCHFKEVPGQVVVCDGCERGFHLACAGMRGEQAEIINEWMCRECVSNNVQSNRWPLGWKTKRKSGRVRLLDINALPYSDGEAEGNEDSPGP
ncbi:unnamed protein product, partial [Ilex paraguariensis]